MAEWMKIKGYPGYEVSDEGQDRSYWTRRGTSPAHYRIGKTPRRIMRPGHDGSGYEMVILYTGASAGKSHKVATLVIEAFRGSRPAGMVVCHNNNLRCDNRLENLRYDTQAGNFADKSESAKRASSQAKLTDRQVVDIRVSKVIDGITQVVLAKRYGVGKSTVSQSCSGITYAHLPGPRTTGKYLPLDALRKHTARAWA